MANTMKNVPNLDSIRMQANREELVLRIAQAMPRDGKLEPQPGVFFHRASGQTEPVHGVVEPSLCVVAQGSKEVLLAGERYRYDPAHYLITTLELPAMAQIIEASRERPYLSFRLILDAAVVTSVVVESGTVQVRGAAGTKAIDVSPVDADLLDATVRLVRLIENPPQYRMLAPLIIREIVYRLLTGAQGNRLLHLAQFGGQEHRVVRAVEKLRKSFDKPLRIEAIAREMGMSLSGFHSHFKAVTAMSPLQYQKELRLQEARRLMLSENLDAGEAGFRVGYEDQSHFSRDYKRHFGEPPMRDVEKLREMAMSDT
jgi:AraC-like DNA-binding protein